MAAACATVERASAEHASLTLISAPRAESALPHPARKDEPDVPFEVRIENVLPGVPL